MLMDSKEEEMKKLDNKVKICLPKELYMVRLAIELNEKRMYKQENNSMNILNE